MLPIEAFLNPIYHYNQLLDSHSRSYQDVLLCLTAFSLIEASHKGIPGLTIEDKNSCISLRYAHDRVRDHRALTWSVHEVVQSMLDIDLLVVNVIRPISIELFVRVKEVAIASLFISSMILILDMHPCLCKRLFRVWKLVMCIEMTD